MYASNYSKLSDGNICGLGGNGRIVSKIGYFNRRNLITLLQDDGPAFQRR